MDLQVKKLMVPDEILVEINGISFEAIPYTFFKGSRLKYCCGGVNY